MCEGPHAAGTAKGPRAGNAQPSAAADLLLQRSTSGRERRGREGGKRGILEPATRSGGGWELEERGMERQGLGSRACSPWDCQKRCPGPLPGADPLAQRDPALLGGAGGEGRTRGSQLSTCEETLPNSSGGETAAKGAPRTRTPPCWAKRPGMGVCNGARRAGGSAGGSATQAPHEQGAKSHAEHRQSRAMGWDRQRLAGAGSAWPGQALLSSHCSAGMLCSCSTPPQRQPGRSHGQTAAPGEAVPLLHPQPQPCSSQAQELGHLGDHPSHTPHTGQWDRPVHFFIPASLGSAQPQSRQGQPHSRAMTLLPLGLCQWPAPLLSHYQGLHTPRLCTPGPTVPQNLPWSSPSLHASSILHPGREHQHCWHNQPPTASPHHQINPSQPFPHPPVLPVPGAPVSWALTPSLLRVKASA